MAKRDDLGREGVPVREALISVGDMTAISNAKAWENEVKKAFPKKLGSLANYSDRERQIVEEEVRKRVPTFSLTSGSTHGLDEEDVKTHIGIVTVMIDRLQYGKMHAKKPPRGDLDKHVAYAKQLLLQPGYMSNSEAARQAIAKYGWKPRASEEAAFDTIRKHPKLVK